jgi:inner membrane protein
MNSKEHFTLAFILLIIIYFILNYFNLNAYFSYSAVLLIGAILPDIIEYPKDWKHRKFFHSKRFLRGCCYSLIITLVLGLLINSFLYIFFLTLGYISHLALDSTTPRGLPN